MSNPTRKQPGIRSKKSIDILVTRAHPKPSSVYYTFWRFATERHHTFLRRLTDAVGPWTTDPIIAAHRFTNVFRAADRVSQYLIRCVQHREDLPNDPANIVFRTILFKLFNRIETWELLESRLPSLTLETYQTGEVADMMSKAVESGRKLYSAAYIMPSTSVLGESQKHRGHLKLVEMITRPPALERILKAPDLRVLYEELLGFPTLGPFLAFQLAIDLNYSGLFPHDEMEFVVAGPGARDGIRKCFRSLGDYNEADTIRWVTEHQLEHAQSTSDGPPDLFGRQLQLIDIQNIFCEVSKYARVAHPDVAGTTSRTRIKQVYRASPEPLSLFFPQHWGINEAIPAAIRCAAETTEIPATLFDAVS